jgi:tetratricopeptide (TPR) repeat protein
VDAYHAGDWTTAIDLCAPVIDHPAETVAAEARWVRGRIGLARGDPSLALEDAERIVERAMIGWNDEILIQGLALLAVAHHARGDPEAAAGACQRFFDRWKEIGGLPNQAPAVAALAVVSNQHDALREATMLLPDASRWKPALTAIVEKRYTDAATTYGEIGSLPLAAEAYLLAARQAADAAGHADATQYAEQALSFYRRVDATAYIREAEALLTRARSA